MDDFLPYFCFTFKSKGTCVVVIKIDDNRKDEFEEKEERTADSTQKEAEESSAAAEQKVLEDLIKLDLTNLNLISCDLQISPIEIYHPTFCITNITNGLLG